MSQGRDSCMCQVSPRLQRGREEARGCGKGTAEQKHPQTQEKVSAAVKRRY